MKRFFFFILALFILFNAALGGVAAYGWHLFTSAGPLTQDHILVLDKGMGLRSIAARLEKEGVIHNDIAFVFGVRIEGQTKLLKAGEYLFKAGSNGADVMALLVSGKTIAHFITIPEGLQSREIVSLIQAEQALSGELAEPLPEGSVLPETYHYTRGESRNAIALRMKAAMDKALTTLWKGRTPDDRVPSKEALLILASIVEKETGVASERAHVASVFLNRIRRKMRLQSDPTVVYGVTQGQSELGRPIYKKDLAAVNEYNTYTLNGLPKGPICNPGLDSLKAVLSPLVTKDLYFVADGSGGHKFAKNLAQHNRNVRAWRKLQKSK